MSSTPVETDVVHLRFKDVSCVTVHLYGATIISWKIHGQEIIFVSSKSHFDNKKAIRGGIPLVFPNFGPWANGPQHGFARIARWCVDKSPEQVFVMVDEDSVQAVFTLESNDDTRKMWNYSFKLIYTVILRENNLEMKFDVMNTGESCFDFTCLLHTYFAVSDVTKSTISGLNGFSYIDKVEDGQQFKESHELVSVNQNVDRVYEMTGNTHTVTGVANGTVIIEKNHFPDTVVWNPWKDKAAAMADFGDEEYPNMLCVEVGYVSKPFTLEAQNHFKASQKLIYEKSQL